MRKFAQSGSTRSQATRCKVHCSKPEKGVPEVYEIVAEAIASCGADADDFEVFQEMPINTRSAVTGRMRKGKCSRIDMVVAFARGEMLGIEVNGSKEHQHDPAVRKRDSCKRKAWCLLDNAVDYFVVPGRHQGGKKLRKDAWLQSFRADLTAAVHNLCVRRM